MVTTIDCADRIFANIHPKRLWIFAPTSSTEALAFHAHAMSTAIRVAERFVEVGAVLMLTILSIKLIAANAHLKRPVPLPLP
jgi:hypothetical protein